MSFDEMICNLEWEYVGLAVFVVALIMACKAVSSSEDKAKSNGS